MVLKNRCIVQGEDAGILYLPSDSFFGSKAWIARS